MILVRHSATRMMNNYKQNPHLHRTGLAIDARKTIYVGGDHNHNNNSFELTMVRWETEASQMGKQFIETEASQMEKQWI